MAIEKINLYTPGNNLMNLALNVDYNRLSEDKSQITVNFATTPATVTIKRGSIIECNGNRYLINGSDYSFQMANANHNYITFTDNPSIALGSASGIGTFNTEKQGHYQIDNVTRTLKFYIDQSNENYYVLLDAALPNLTLITKRYDKIKVCLTVDHYNTDGSPLRFNLIKFDELGSWDTANYKWICPEYGYYYIGLKTYSTTVATNIAIMKNGAQHVYIHPVYASYSLITSLVDIFDFGDEIRVDIIAMGAGRFLADEADTHLTIARVL
jgi:hypothetical protein